MFAWSVGSGGLFLLFVNYQMCGLMEALFSCT